MASVYLEIAVEKSLAAMALLPSAFKASAFAFVSASTSAALGAVVETPEPFTASSKDLPPNLAEIVLAFALFTSKASAMQSMATSIDSANSSLTVLSETLVSKNLMMAKAKSWLVIDIERWKMKTCRANPEF